MDWSEACEATRVTWQGVLDGIGKRDPVDLITEINEVSEVCCRAQEDAGAAAERCSHCLVFGEAQRCADARWRISEALLDGKLDEARAAVMGVVAQLQAARADAAR